MLSDLLGNLLEDAFDGESCVDVLLDMIIGKVAPVADAAGASTVHDATTLLRAMCARVIADLLAAPELARNPPLEGYR